jgi:acid stress chaperone HdeB
MKITFSMLFAAAFVLSSVPAKAVVLDLSTMTCKQFIEGGDDDQDGADLDGRLV